MMRVSSNINSIRRLQSTLWSRRGRREGRVDGVAEGLLQGRREMLLELLRARFGELPESAVARVEAADAGQLALWAKGVLSAQFGRVNGLHPMRTLCGSPEAEIGWPAEFLNAHITRPVLVC